MTKIKRSPGRLRTAKNTTEDQEISLQQIKEQQQENKRNLQKNSGETLEKKKISTKKSGDQNTSVDHSGLFSLPKKDERISRTISIPKRVWDRVEEARKKNNFKHSSTIVERVLDRYLPVERST